MNDAVTSFAKRREIREQLQRSGSEGIRVDVATLCRCEKCGGMHYKPRTEQTESDQKVK